MWRAANVDGETEQPNAKWTGLAPRRSSGAGGLGASRTSLGFCIGLARHVLARRATGKYKATYRASARKVGRGNLPLSDKRNADVPSTRPTPAHRPATHSASLRWPWPPAPAPCRRSKPFLKRQHGHALLVLAKNRRGARELFLFLDNIVFVGVHRTTTPSTTTPARLQRSHRERLGAHNTHPPATLSAPTGPSPD